MHVGYGLSDIGFSHLYQTREAKREIKDHVEMFYLNTIEQLFLLVEQLDQLEVCLPYTMTTQKVDM